MKLEELCIVEVLRKVLMYLLKYLPVKAQEKDFLILDSIEIITHIKISIKSQFFYTNFI